MERNSRYPILFAYCCLFLGAVMLLAGCGQQDKSTDGNGNDDNQAVNGDNGADNNGDGQEAATNGSSNGKVTLKKVLFKEAVDFIKEQKGKIVVLDIWGFY